MLTGDTDGQPLVKLIDLGIAKTLEGAGGELTSPTGIFLGKPRYASPEQFGADGATAVDAPGRPLLLRRRPLRAADRRGSRSRASDPSSLMAGHLFRPPLDFAESDPGGRVPAELRAAVLKALAKRPEDRFATAAELVARPRRLPRPFRSPRRGAEKLPGPALHPRRGPVDRRAGEHARTGWTRSSTWPATPSPGTLLQLAKTAVPAARRAWGDRAPLPRRARGALAEGLAEALAEIGAALEKRSYRAAESLLYAAEASFGAREEFAALYERVAEERREAA